MAGKSEGMTMKKVFREKTENRYVKGHWGKAAVCIFAVIFLLTACGRASKDSSSGSYAPAEEGYAAAEAESASWDEIEESDEEYYRAEEAAEAAGAEGAGSPLSGKGESGSTESGDATDGQSSNRKIIYTGNISLQSLEYEKSAESIHGKITGYGGFIESEDTSNDDPYWYYKERTGSASQKTRRNMNVTARIPADKFDAFMKDLENDGQVISTSVNARNISVKYANHEASRKALEIEQKRLLDMMEKAETVEDMIAVEARLTDVERELNDEKTQLSDMDRDVNFSTVYISLQEVFEYSEQVVEISYGEKLKKAFSRAVSDFVEFWGDLILGIVETFPFLIMFGLIIFAIVKASRRARRRREEKLAEMQNAQGGYPFNGTQMPGAQRRSFFRKGTNDRLNGLNGVPGQPGPGSPAQQPGQGGAPAQQPAQGGMPARQPVQGGTPVVQGGTPAQQPVQDGTPAQQSAQDGKSEKSDG